MDLSHERTTAWLQVFGSFLVMFNAWGIVNAYGAYQTFYQTGELFQASSSAISWIGAIQGCLLLLLGPITGPLYDAGYSRTLISVGTFLVVFGQMMLSLCTEYWQALLAQGLCMGIGIGCLYVPSTAILAVYFKTRRATAIGIAACGSSLGGVVYPIAFHKLQPMVGFGWTTRILGFIEFVTLMINLIVRKHTIVGNTRRKIIDWTAFRDINYMAYVIGATVGFSGLYVPFFYLEQYILQKHLATKELGFYALAIINGASTFGRLVPSFIADFLGAMNVLLPCTIVSGVLIFLLPIIHNFGGVLAFCIVFGIFSATFVSMPATIMVSLSPNSEYVGTRMGMGYATMALGLLVGNPIAGEILSFTSFHDIWVFSGSLVMASGIIIFIARMRIANWRLLERV